MIRITAYEYVLQERTMREQKRKKQKADHGFQLMLEAEIQKLKGEGDSERVQNKKI